MVLAKLQKQLLAQSVQLELFRELVKVEKDMFILLLSMLEGNLYIAESCVFKIMCRQHQCMYSSQDDIHINTVIRTC